LFNFIINSLIFLYKFIFTTNFSYISKSYISISRYGKSKLPIKKASDLTEKERSLTGAKDILIGGVDAQQRISLRDGGRGVIFRYGNYDFTIQEVLMGEETENKETSLFFIISSSTRRLSSFLISSSILFIE